MFLVTSFLTGFSQGVIDSLELKLANHTIAESRIPLLIQLSDAYLETNAEKSLNTSKKALELSKNINDTLSIMECLYQIGNTELDLGLYKESLNSFQNLETISIEDGDKEYLAKSYFGIGLVNYYLDYINEAKKNWEKELVVEREMKDKRGIALTLGNLSAIQIKIGDTLKSLELDKEALNIYYEIEDNRGIASTLYNISSTYIALKRHKEAIDYSYESLKLNKANNKLKSIGLSYMNIANIFALMEEIENSELYIDSSLSYMERLNNLNEIAANYKTAASVYSQNNNYEKAFLYNDKYVLLYDSLTKVENRSLVAEMNTKYETEKKEKANELLRKQGELDTLEITSQRKQRVYLFTGLGLAFILLVVIFNRFKKSQKQKKLIEEQKKEVEHQKELIEEKSTEITDSINYAQRIQQALLKSEEHVSEQFPPHFILLKPKDIVSGDFYWAAEKNGELYISVADCTGHGVPGGFMSMLGIALLNEINSVEEVLSPSIILDRLRDRIIRELSQTSGIEGSKDGMDMCLMKLSKDRKSLEWAGANNPLYIVNEGQVEEIKADRQPVAYYDHSKPFTNHTITIKPNSSFYMFSDGYVDQFGGPRGKKFKSKQYKELLLRINFHKMETQKVELNLAFENWRGDLEQIDDVCVIGLRI